MYFASYHIIFAILTITMVLFIWGKWRYDIVALIGLALCVVCGVVPFKDVYSGLDNPAVITVACVMVLSQAITRSGILNPIMHRMTTFTKSFTLQVASLSMMTALLSAFMNNIGALALMMPISIQLARDSNRSVSLLLMPIALSSALGGLTTLIGTPPNLLISAYRQKISGHAFTMFDYSHCGLLLALAGILFIIILGWRLLPQRMKASKTPDDMFPIQDYITEVKINEKSPMINATVKELESLVQGDYTIIGLIRNKSKRLGVTANQKLEANDILIIESSPEDLQKLLHVGRCDLVADSDLSRETLKTDTVTLLEAVVPQASRIEGRSSKSMRLRSRFQINILAIARGGTPFKQRMSQVKLQAGDVVLLQGPSITLQETAIRLGFLPLIERGIHVNSSKRNFLPIGIFAISILLSVLQLVPVQVAFGAAILSMLLLNVIPIRNLYENIEWPVIILLAAMIPIGQALQTTGGTAHIAHYLINFAGHASPIWVLGFVLVITMTLSDFMNNAATTVVMAPIAVSIAHTLYLSIDPFLMAVAIGASCSFLTPVGHQNNTLVMGPGGYKFTDYIRIGLPLEIIIIVISLPLISWVWPF